MNNVHQLEPAALEFDAAGVPWSTRYGDIYHSADSGPGQARHVFLDGNGLPHRWQGRPSFVILENGFGLGVNFLATWQTWRDDAKRPDRLHYVAIEKHPFSAESLAQLHARYAAFAALSAELRAAWPMLVPGVHRVSLAGGRVLLTLCFGDAEKLLPMIDMVADAIYLDGFAPARNPDMWSAPLIKALSRKSRAGTSFATYSSAAAVRRALEAAGFACEKCAGFGAKREMLRGHYAPRWPQRKVLTPHSPAQSRRAMVIGAGLAGAAVCERLASRGWQIDLIDAAPAPAAGASGLHAGMFHPHLSPDDCLLSRLSRNAFLLGLARWQALEAAGHRIEWARCGVLQLPRDPAEEAALTATLAALAYPPRFADFADRQQASALAGTSLGSGGWWFAEGGWLRSPTLVAAQIAAAGAQVRTLYAATVHRLERHIDGWQALSEDGRVLATAPVVVLANAVDAQVLASFATPLRRIRGQLGYFPDSGLALPHCVVSGNGYVLPPIEGCVVAGSTYETEESPPLSDAEAYATNRSRLAHLLPDFAYEEAHEKGSDLRGIRQSLTPFYATPPHAAWRAVARDRLPLAGAVPDVAAARADASRLSGAHLGDLPRLPGLYCATGFASRGITWSALAAELLASLIEGEPLPMEKDLAEAIDPGRFALRALRHGRL